MSEADWQPVQAVDALKASVGSRGVTATLALSPQPDDQWERSFNNASLPWSAGWQRPKAVGRELLCEGVPEEDLDRFIAAVKEMIVAANESYRNILAGRRRQDAEKLVREERDEAVRRRIREVLRAE